MPGRQNKAEAHGDLQTKDLAERELSTWSPRTLSSEGVDGQSWNEAVGRESMAVMTRGLLRKKSLLVWDSFQAHLVDSVKR